MEAIEKPVKATFWLPRADRIRTSEDILKEKKRTGNGLSFSDICRALLNEFHEDTELRVKIFRKYKPVKVKGG